MTKKKESIKVVITDRMPADRALKKFKRLCETYGIVREYRKRQAHTKPSIALREKREAAEKRRVKAIKKFRGRRSKI